MARRRRRMFTAAESAEVWDRWQRGEGLKLIGRVFGRTSSAIFAHLKPHGGIRPAPRRRSRWAQSRRWLSSDCCLLWEIADIWQPRSGPRACVLQHVNAARNGGMSSEGQPVRA
jgi:hypothetical protein